MTPQQRSMAKARVVYSIMKRKGTLPTQKDKFLAHPTPLKAIRLFCLDCQAGSRKAIKHCDNKECPLWLFRTRTNKKKTPTQ